MHQASHSADDFGDRIRGQIARLKTSPATTKGSSGSTAARESDAVKTSVAQGAGAGQVPCRAYGRLSSEPRKRQLDHARFCLTAAATPGDSGKPPRQQTARCYSAARRRLRGALASSAARSAIRSSSETNRHRLVRRDPELRARPERCSSRSPARTFASLTPARVDSATRLRPFSDARSSSSSSPAARSRVRRFGAGERDPLAGVESAATEALGLAAALRARG